MSLVGAAAVVAMGNVLDSITWPSDEDASKNTDIVKVPPTVDNPKIEPTQTQVLPPPTATPQTLLQPTSIQTDAPVEISLPTPTQIATLPPPPTLEETSSPTCIVRCSRQCSYPGRCRRYVDVNQNNLCDFGECM
ncbi:MAG: hypothetical protein JXB30_15395 [Anaerolineae bacterium]|nr:hypothetical protein [Anaerolineae bacterium]